MCWPTAPESPHGDHMTTEDDFQRQLDEHPDDFQTRLVFADWLEERNDPRAEGYRVLGMLRKWPKPLSDWWWANARVEPYMADHEKLDYDWYRRMQPSPPPAFANYSSRRSAEDAAALAFAKLPEERRAELLRGVPA